MLNEVEQYLKAIEKIEADFQAERLRIDKAYTEHGDYDLMGAEASVNRGRTRLGHKAARAELAKSGDPLAAWIAEHVLADYPDHAHDILRALPVESMEPLQRIAYNGDWCETWDGFVAQAEAAGVLPGQPKRTAEYRTLMRWFAENFTTRTDRNNDLRVHLDALIAAEVAAAVAAADDQAAAK